MTIVALGGQIPFKPIDPRTAEFFSDKKSLAYKNNIVLFFCSSILISNSLLKASIHLCYIADYLLMRQLMLDEAKIIHRLKNAFPDYIGDDAAVIPTSGNNCYVITKDILVEDVHFRSRYVDAASLAQKALQVNLSDIAAMGAEPQFVLLGFSLPLSHEKYAEDFLREFCAACKASSLILIGGDTTRSPDKLFISVTVIGQAKTENLKYRTTAKTDDLICVVGNLGYAHLGLQALESSLNDFTEFKQAFLTPQANLAEGKWLGSQPKVHAMMDISDGLYLDLKRLCAASQVAAEVNLDKLQLSKTFTSACKQLDLDPLTTALTGGEDYGLLFTLAPEDYSDFAQRFATKHDKQIKCLGRIVEGDGIHFIQNGQPKHLELKSFSHFGE